MKCIVCVKQVPDTSGVVAVKEDGTMDRAAMDTITNHDDLAAVEAALRIKDATGCKVVVISMGPPPAEGMLRELLARGACRRWDTVPERLLEKIRDNPAQSALSDGAVRWENVRDVYRAAPPEAVRGRRVLLVDDICTTGATLSECAKVLAEAGAETVVCAAAARTPLGG